MSRSALHLERFPGFAQKSCPENRNALVRGAGQRAEHFYEQQSRAKDWQGNRVLREACASAFLHWKQPKWPREAQQSSLHSQGQREVTAPCSSTKGFLHRHNHRAGSSLEFRQGGCHLPAARSQTKAPLPRSDSIYSHS